MGSQESSPSAALRSIITGDPSSVTRYTKYILSSHGQLLRRLRRIIQYDFTVLAQTRVYAIEGRTTQHTGVLGVRINAIDLCVYKHIQIIGISALTLGRICIHNSVQ